MDAKDLISKIYFTRDACKVLDRIVLSCSVSETPLAFRKLLRLGSSNQKKIFLLDVFPFEMFSTAGFINLAQEKGSYQIDRNDVLIVFGGKLHINAVEDRTKKPYQQIVGEKKNYKERLEELDIDFFYTNNCAVFALFDFLLIGVIKEIKQSNATLTINNFKNNLKLLNVAIPKDENIKIGQKVATHYGAIIETFKNTNEDKKIISAIKFIQKESSFFQNTLKSLKNRTIDFEKVCASPQKKGMNLTKWFLDRY